MNGSWKRGIQAAFATVLVALALPAAASGSIVFERGSDLWVMDDSGANQRQLLSAANVGASGIDTPHASPDGSVLVFAGDTPVPNHATHCGSFCTGVYKVERGAVQRLSSPAGPCAGPCSLLETSPEVTGDGHYVFQRTFCAGAGLNLSCDGSLMVGSLASGTIGGWGARCDSDFDHDPSPNPVNPAEIVYAGCNDGAGNSSLFASGRNRAGERQIACDDDSMNEPSWSPDGSRIVDTEAGTDPGLWVYDTAQNSCSGAGFTYALAQPGGVFFSSPRFAGAGTIVFAAEGDIWSIPSSCGSGGGPCAFPGDATQLTSGPDADFAPAWTPTLAFAQSPAPPDGGGPGAGDPGGGGPGGGDPGAGDGDGASGDDDSGACAKAKQKVKALKAKLKKARGAKKSALKAKLRRAKANVRRVC